LDYQFKKTRWNELSKTSNFLKHADRDHQSAISLKDIDNQTIILRASAAYSMLNQNPTPEMSVFYIFSSLNSVELAPDDDVYAAIAEKLAKFSPAQRRRACLRLVRQWDKIFDCAEFKQTV
jgi:hypothetical protein